MRKKPKKGAGRPSVSCHVRLGGQVRDTRLAADSCRVDAAADRQWFRDHPGVEERWRRATLLEVAAFGVPLGTRVVVQLEPDGSQARLFLFPPGKTSWE